MFKPTRTTNRPSGGAMRRRRAIVLGITPFLAVLAASAATASSPDGLPPLSRTGGRTFSIPFRTAKGASADADPKRVVLNVSKDLGLSWEDAAEASPSAGAFTYQAEVDGEYWFRLRSIDAEGRIRGGLGPDVRVLVNAAGPRLAGRVWKGENGEVVCRFAAVDDTIDASGVVVEWRSTAEPQWQAVAASPVLTRESPAHLLGEEFWWAGDRTAGLVVRVSVPDNSGHKTVRQFPIEATDPGVDQGMLAAEIGAPALPSASPASSAMGAAPLRSSAPDASTTRATRQDAYAADRRPPPPPTDTDGNGNERRAADGSIFRAASAGTAHDLSRPSTSSDLGLPSGSSSTYRGRPLHLSRSRSFAWKYALPPDAPDRRVELWGTLDGGVTWQRFAEDPDGKSPIDVHLEQAALYGFRLEIGPLDASLGLAPRSGESPDCWLGIDESPPDVRFVRSAAERVAAATVVVIEYASQDPLLMPTGTRLSYAPSASGPWVCIAEGLDATGSYRWSPDRSVPAEVYLRVESRDAAGNVGMAGSAGPVSLTVERSKGLLEDIVPAPGDTDP